MRGRALALGLGSVVAIGIVAGAESWVRSEEEGAMVLVFDPPEMKYAIGPGTAGRGRGWVEGRAPRPRRPGIPRVVAVGDSVTYGVRVDPRDAWPGALDRLLEEARAPAPREEERVEMLNFGVNGWDAGQVAAMVDTRLAPWEPDVVVWGSYANDLVPTFMLYGQESGRPVFVGSSVPAGARILPEVAARFLLRRSALFRRLQGLVYARAAGEIDPREASEEFYARALDRMLAWSARASVPFLVLAIPPHVLADPDRCPESFGGDTHPCEVAADRHARLCAILAARGARWVDGLPALRASGEAAFHPEQEADPDHPGAAGHALLAGAIRAEVEGVIGGR